MKYNDNNSIYNYFVVPLSTVKKTWLNLLQNKDKVLPKDLHEEVELLYGILESTKTDSLTVYFQRTIASLPVAWIEDYISGRLTVDEKNDFESKILSLYVCVYGIPELEIYTIDQLRDMLGKEDDTVVLTLHNTLREIAIDNNDDKSGYLDIFYAFLNIDDLSKDRTLNWADSLFFGQMLFVAWEFFGRTGFDDKEYLIKNYLYLSIVVGVQVKEKITATIYGAVDWQRAVLLYGFYNSVITDLKEIVPVGNSQERKMELKPLKDVLKVIDSRTGDQKGEAYAQIKFMEDLYVGQEHRDKYLGWLREILSVTLGIKRGSLVDEIQLSESTQGTEQFQDQMSDLIAWLINKEWEKIFKYYRGSSCLIPLNIFFRYISDFYDLSKDKTQDMFLEFTQFLHDKKILSEDVELIEYDEETEGFEWNLEYIHNYDRR